MKPFDGFTRRPSIDSLEITPSQQLRKWERFQAEMILVNILEYCRYALNNCNLEKLKRVRGLSIDRSIIHL